MEETSDLWYGRDRASMFGGPFHGLEADRDQEGSLLLRSVSTAVYDVQTRTLYEHGLWTLFNGLDSLIFTDVLVVRDL